MSYKIYLSYFTISIILISMGLVWFFSYVFIIASQSSFDWQTLFLSAPNLLLVFGIVELIYGFIIMFKKKSAELKPYIFGIISLCLAAYYVIYWMWFLSWFLIIVALLLLQGILFLFITLKPNDTA